MDMSDPKKPMARHLGPLDEEELITSGIRHSPKDFGFQWTYGLRRFTGCLGQVPASLALQLFSLALFTVLLVAILVQVSEAPGSQGLENSKQEEIYQELTHLKAGVARLCRPCPWDWTFFQGNCYFFSKTQRNWHDSITACQEVGAQLVVIKTAEEQLLTSNRLTWMGLSDLKHEGTWHWLDGSPLLLSFMKYWNKGEPNSSGEEDCAEFRSEGWNDSKCDWRKFWICKNTSTPCSSD
ncbi:CD209 antigen-like protein 2 isoform X2 [Tamandua tetradactyla]|uniref:CD209 antigen-like protein 2 isoform X2 n=1 Tax=Tamandua tetradactyla TaxID=48850 RepID=UPI00405461A7